MRLPDEVLWQGASPQQGQVPICLYMLRNGLDSTANRGYTASSSPVRHSQAPVHWLSWLLHNAASLQALL